MKWMSYGPHALLVQFAEHVGDEAFARGRTIAAELERHPPPGLIEFVPAFTSVLLEFDAHDVPEPSRIAPELLTKLENAAALEMPLGPVKELPVTYDGPDLERVAELHQLSVVEVCRIHSAPVYKVYMLGFAPGFPYLGELDARLHTPRLESPRPRVPAGSVGIGGQHTGIYSMDFPGGWNIIGRTPTKIFDPDYKDESMFLLRPGERVKFVAMEAGS